ncbi:unnamed protein product [Calypogeia fissa]
MSLLFTRAGGSLAPHCSMSSLNFTTMAPRMVVQAERGLPFQVGSAFYRRQSALARDLGVLMAAVHAQQNGGSLRVMDVMSGCGVRAARYLHQAGADFVWANDACGDLAEILTSNLSQGGKGGEVEGRWRITHEDANRLLLGCTVREDYFDFIDVDSFGSDSLCLGPALGAVKFGGLVYATCTDGFSSGGHRPHNAVATYGAFIGPMPFANEIGLRMLIGGAVREAATRNMNVFPAFSNYSYHGPVFRTMLRVQPGKPMVNRNYGFITFCKLCGESKDVQWEALGDLACSCPYPKEPRSLIVSGPLWIGPLHSATDVKTMAELAKEWGWISRSELSRESRKSDSSVDMYVLEELLEIMLDESQPGLPSGFMELNKISKRGKMQTPKRTEFMKVLQQEGYFASRSHISSNAVKTNCSMKACIELSRKMAEVPSHC